MTVLRMMHAMTQCDRLYWTGWITQTPSLVVWDRLNWIVSNACRTVQPEWFLAPRLETESHVCSVVYSGFLFHPESSSSFVCACTRWYTEQLQRALRSSNNGQLLNITVGRKDVAAFDVTVKGPKLWDDPYPYVQIFCAYLKVSSVIKVVCTSITKCVRPSRQILLWIKVW